MIIKNTLRKIISKKNRYKLLVFRCKFLWKIDKYKLNLRKFFKIKDKNKEIFYFDISSKVNEKITSILSESIENKLIYIYQFQFFDKKGENCFSGGGERYTVDLADLFADLGYKTILFQLGEENKKVWLRHKNKLHIIGIPSSFDDYLNIINYLISPKLSIYSGYQRWGSLSQIQKPSIIISHGITWDTPLVDASIIWIKEILDCFNYLVSVDTNTISYLRSTFSASLSKNKKNMIYIPNYVDGNLFKPKKEKRESNLIKITFPRRLSNERGFWLFSRVAEKLLNIYPNVEIEFVGFIHDYLIEDNLNHLKNIFGERIKHVCVDQDKMNLIYQKTDISVIPTLYSEGTSLSCLEAMACGNAVVATNVGGLPNLIIDNFNGLLVNPDEEEIFVAISSLIENEQMRNTISKNAILVSKKFSKNEWKRKWIELLKKFL